MGSTFYLLFLYLTVFCVYADKKISNNIEFPRSIISIDNFNDESRIYDNYHPKVTYNYKDIYSTQKIDPHKSKYM